jgi:hypothetical protein
MVCRADGVHDEHILHLCRFKTVWQIALKEREKVRDEIASLLQALVLTPSITVPALGLNARERHALASIPKRERTLSFTDSCV